MLTPKFIQNSENGNKWFVRILAAIVGLGGILFGFDTGVISGAIVFIKKTFSLTTFEIEITVSAVLLGALIGAAGIGKIADHYGRRKALLLAASGFIIGSILSAFAPSILILIISRLIVGFAIGISSFAVPLYISEIAPVKERGSLVILNTIAVTLGIVIAYLIDYAFTPLQSWRWMLGIGVIPGLLMGIGILILPCSPRWLMQSGNILKARKILQRIRPAQNVETELKEIAHIVGKKEGTWVDLFKPMLRPVVIIGMGLAIIQQVTGINVILYYAPIIFKAAGFKGASAQMLATLGMGITNFLMTIVALCLVDKVGRRRLLLIGLSFMSASLMIVALSFHEVGQYPIIKWACVLSIISFLSFYAFSIGCLFWLLIAEIYPLNVRGKAMSLAAATNWAANLIVALTFLSLLELLGATETFLIYATGGILSVIFCYLLVPETKLVSLEKIEENLRAGKASRDLGTTIR